MLRSYGTVNACLTCRWYFAGADLQWLQESCSSPSQSSLPTSKSTLNVSALSSLWQDHFRDAAVSLPPEPESPVPVRSSGRQGTVEPFTLVHDPAAWRASDWAGRTDHIYQLSSRDIEELRDAVECIFRKKLEVEGNLVQLRQSVASKSDFPLPTLGPKLQAICHEVSFGRGFQLIRGVPVQEWSRLQVLVAYWGMGLWLGKVMPQNKKGHIIGHIKDIGGDVHNPTTRIYLTRMDQPWHCDSADIVGLLCLQPAKEGGLSSFSSSVSVHNELLRRGRQDLVEELTKDEWYLDRKNEIPEGKLPYYRLPIFNYHQGHLATSFSATYYELAQRHADVPKLTKKQEEALAAFSALAMSPELRLDWMLQPGDIQLLHNTTMLHTRTAWEDFEDGRKRHLLRLWVAPEQDKVLPPAYAEQWGSTEIGDRGGMFIPGSVPTVPLEAE
ncbi:hypothetical protein WJX74_006847 [Apatococcus lobatus]|uniref:TauD/TfdA-like domain-containing protein n=1 Tax=Apatococcus lobatus TaxID=904363 RepID=A0AAW1QMU6_9CHLO